MFSVYRVTDYIYIYTVKKINKKIKNKTKASLDRVVGE